MRKNLFFEKYLLSNEKILLNDHISTNTKKIFIYFNENINDNIFLIVKKNKKISLSSFRNYLRFKFR